jgi:hypothetical protein
MTEAAVPQRTRGGMCSNPFGGHSRLDRLDLMQYLESNASPEKVLYLATIQDAVHNYLFFALGRNGTTAEEFVSSAKYFFQVRATDQQTWSTSRFLRSTYIGGNGKRQTTTIKLTDSQLKSMCFDTHYDYSGLAELMPMDRFLTWLKRRRGEILQENWNQVTSYLDSVREKDARRVLEGSQAPLPRIWSETDRLTLVEPAGPKEVAELLYIPRSFKQLVEPYVAKSCFIQPRLAKLLRPVQPVKGQLFLGVYDVVDPEVAGHDGSGSICSGDPGRSFAASAGHSG